MIKGFMGSIQEVVFYFSNCYIEDLLRKYFYNVIPSLKTIFYISGLSFFLLSYKLPCAGICGSGPSLLGCLAPSPKQWGWCDKVSQDRIGGPPRVPLGASQCRMEHSGGEDRVGWQPTHCSFGDLGRQGGGSVQGHTLRSRVERAR